MNLPTPVRRASLLLPTIALAVALQGQTTPQYDSTIVARTGGTSLVSIDDVITCSDKGAAAFVGRYPEAGTNVIVPALFLADADGAVLQLTFNATSQNLGGYGPGLSLLEDGAIVARRFVLQPAPARDIDKWTLH